MNKIRFPTFVAIAFLIANHATNAEDEDRTKGISITTSEPEFANSPIDKRDSRGQIGSYNTNLPQQNYNTPNDEPFRPMYQYFNRENQAPTKYEDRQTSGAQPPETYYGTSQQASKQEASKAPLTAPQTPTMLPGHSGVPLAGSFLSSGGGLRHNLNAFRGPFNNIFYQKEQPQKAASKQEVIIKPTIAPLQESKKPQYTAAYFEANAPNQNQYYHSPTPHQTHYVLQQTPPHYQQRQQPYYQPTLYQNTEAQAAPGRAIPQHHIQYIIAIPLSHLRQLQQQQQQQQQRLAGKTAQPITGQSARISYLNGEVEPKPSQQNPSQYTTQYVQLPANVLHAAIQAAHNFQHRRQHVHEHQQTPAYGHHFIYYPHQHQQQNQQQQQHYEPSQPAPFVVNASPEKQKPQQEAIIYTNDLKAAPNALPQQKEVRILPTSTTAPVATVSQVSLPHSQPIVHYNPVYVQAPPPEQQAIFGGANYHRFATGAFQATTPVPFIRLAPVTQPFGHHYYTPIPQQPQHQHINPFYAHYLQEQIPTHGLPYFTHPGGVHYGTHLYHPPAHNFVTAGPTTAAKIAETVHNKQQQPQQQQQHNTQQK